jgi:hypothetical protein
VTGATQTPTRRSTSGPRPGSATSPPRRRRLIRWAGVLGVVALAVVGYSVAGALRRPGNDTIAQRLAEWGRDHHLNWVVTRLEQTQYQLHPPKAGGSIAGGIPTAPGEHATTTAAPALPHSPVPAPLEPFVAHPAPTEGKWQDVVVDHGLAAVRITYLRPDDGHTSYLAAVLWLDPKLLTGRLHEGITDPGGSWNTPDHITAALASSVAAAMPGGFRTNSGPVGNRGGYYDQGRVAEPLRTGAASLVIATDGTVSIGQWGRDVAMSPAVRSVRQNLDLLVDGGTVSPTCASGSTAQWGFGVANNAFVPRTGIGQRADGALVFVNSPVTSVCSLGRLLVQAGATRGMELDINNDWSIGYYYTHEGGAVHSHVTRDNQSKGPDHYFAAQSRDFVAFYLR